MATWDDVRRLALALPEVTEESSGHTGQPQWRVKGKGFAWDRPLRKADREALGDASPDGPILGVRVAERPTWPTTPRAERRPRLGGSGDG
jgi:hypothetical protein